MRRAFQLMWIFSSVVFLGAEPLPPASKPMMAPLPPEIKEMLDAAYPGWRLAYHPPSYVTADFDQDGKKDYALQMIRGPMGSEEQDLVVILHNASGLYLQILESRGEDPNIFLNVKKIVESQPNPATGIDKMVSRDLLRISGGPEGDRTYRWELGEFKEVIEPPPADPSDTSKQ